MPYHFAKSDGVNAGPVFYFPLALFLFWSIESMAPTTEVTASLLIGILFWFCCYELYHDFEHYDLSSKSSGKFASTSRFMQYLFLDSWLGQRLIHPHLSAMKRHHGVHHDKDWRKNFGVSCRFWDRVFSTFEKSG